MVVRLGASLKRVGQRVQIIIIIKRMEREEEKEATANRRSQLLHGLRRLSDCFKIQSEGEQVEKTSGGFPFSRVEKEGEQHCTVFHPPYYCHHD